MATDPTLRLSDAVATGLARRGIHYGWAVASVTFLTMLVTAGAVGAPGVLILPLQKEFGWDTATIGSALAVRLVLFGLMGPFAAALMNRYGPRRIVLLALALIAGGLLASLGMTQVWQLVLLWGVVVGIGTGLTALVLGATVATRWFSRSRGLVVGLLTASSATGQLVVLPLLAALTEALGWRAALLVICALLLAAALGVLALMRDRPEDLGLAPYGETRPVAAPAAPGPSAGGALAAVDQVQARLQVVEPHHVVLRVLQERQPPRVQLELVAGVHGRPRRRPPHPRPQRPGDRGVDHRPGHARVRTRGTTSCRTTTRSTRTPSDASPSRKARLPTRGCRRAVRRR